MKWLTYAAKGRETFGCVVGAVRTPPVSMDEGDVIEIEVRPIGVPRNQVIAG